MRRRGGVATALVKLFRLVLPINTLLGYGRLPSNTPHTNADKLGFQLPDFMTTQRRPYVNYGFKAKAQIHQVVLVKLSTTLRVATTRQAIRFRNVARTMMRMTIKLLNY